ncbi:MAG: NfeD family protein [Christensenellales bacterium]|jgi:membrane-bound serine protease (ClpP class)
MDFIINNLPIVICAVVGMVLLVIEMFMPGFGIPGVSGLILLGASIVMTWMRYGPIAGIGVSIVVIALAALVITLSLKSAESGRLSRSALILRDTLKHDGSVASGIDEGELLNRTGQTLTVLRPAGTVSIDGQRYNVVSSGEFIQKDRPIIVRQVEGSRILVEEIEKQG